VEHICNLEPRNSEFNEIFSSIHVADGRWDNVEKLRKIKMHCISNDIEFQFGGVK